MNLKKPINGFSRPSVSNKQKKNEIKMNGFVEMEKKRKLFFKLELLKVNRRPIHKILTSNM